MAASAAAGGGYWRGPSSEGARRRRGGRGRRAAGAAAGAVAAAGAATVAFSAARGGDGGGGCGGGTAIRLWRAAVFACGAGAAHARASREYEPRLERDPADAAAASALAASHARCAAAAAELCAANGGVWIKAAQFCSASGVLPPEWAQALAPLTDSAPSRPWRDAERVLRAELRARGHASVDAVFAHIDEAPVASASLAQVHLATLAPALGGGQVAIKVQHAGVGAQMGADLALMVLLGDVAAKLMYSGKGGDTKRAALAWVPRAMRARLREELDFRVEARNARRCKADFESAAARAGGAIANVTVPAVMDALTTRRLLVMEAVAGARPDDADALRAAGLSPRAVARTMCGALGEMLFVTGRLHADMHPGNVLVRRRGGEDRRWEGDKAGRAYAAHEVVLLDHGAYCELPVGVRRAYAALWAALGEADAGRARGAAAELGVSAHELDYFALLFASDRAAKRLAWHALEPAVRTALAADVRAREERGSVGADLRAFHASTARELLDVAKAHALLGGTVGALVGAGPDGEWLRLRGLMCAALTARANDSSEPASLPSPTLALTRERADDGSVWGPRLASARDALGGAVARLRLLAGSARARLESRALPWGAGAGERAECDGGGCECSALRVRPRDMLRHSPL